MNNHIVLKTAIGLVVAGHLITGAVHHLGRRPVKVTQSVAIPRAQAQANGPTVTLPILLYHHIADHTPQNPYFVSPAHFEAQLKWLKDNGYHVIPLSEAYKGLTGQAKLPEKAVVITLDDGWADEYTNGFRILKQFGDPATFYIKLNNYNRSRPGAGISKAELQEMRAAGMEIGSHTVNHDNLTHLTPAKLTFELAESKRVLERDLGAPVLDFAYPGGSLNDKVVQAVKAAGYRSATTTVHSIHQNPNDLFRLRRSHIDDELDNLIKRVTGVMS